MPVWCCAGLDLDELVHEMETHSSSYSSLALKLIHSVSTCLNYEQPTVSLLRLLRRGGTGHDWHSHVRTSRTRATTRPHHSLPTLPPPFRARRLHHRLRRRPPTVPRRIPARSLVGSTPVQPRLDVRPRPTTACNMAQRALHPTGGAQDSGVQEEEEFERTGHSRRSERARKGGSCPH